LVVQGDAVTRATFHLGRLFGYTAAGAIAASSVQALAAWSAVSPALRPLWTLLNAGALVLGLMLLVRGRQPAWMARLGSAQVGRRPAPEGWQRVRLQARTALAGALWVAWPCGLLQSALVVAALTDGAIDGAWAMAGFALASAPGLLAGPWLWRRWMSSNAGDRRQTGALRVAGLLLAMASSWALMRQVAPAFAAYCRSLAWT
jgi:sulfite exporter TauE/SafE